MELANSEAMCSETLEMLWKAGEESGCYRGVWFDFWANDGVSIQKSKRDAGGRTSFLRGVSRDAHMCSRRT